MEFLILSADEVPVFLHLLLLEVFELACYDQLLSFESKFELHTWVHLY